MTHSFPFEQFQCDARPRRDETKPSHATVVLPSWGRKPTKRQEQKRWDRACGVRELSPALCVAGMSSLPFPPLLFSLISLPSPSPGPPTFHVRHPHHRRRGFSSAILVSFSPSASARTIVLLQRLVLALGDSMLPPRGRRGYNSRRRPCAPQHA